MNTAWYRVVACSRMALKGLKIRCPKGRAGSTPALGTTFNLCCYNYLRCCDE
jgi:hypothetical protein